MRQLIRMIASLLTALTVSIGIFHGAAAAAESTSGVGIVTENLFVLPAPVVHKVQVVGELSVRNSTTATQAFRFALPAGASSVTVDGKALSTGMRSGQQVNLGRILPPGKTTAVTLMWTLPLSSQQDAQFTLHADAPVYTANVYIPIGNTALSAENLLTTTQTVTVSGTKFREFTRLGIPAGDEWTLSVQMLPSASAAPTTGGLSMIGSHPGTSGSSIGAVANLALVAVILVIGLLSIRATQWGREHHRKSPKDALLDGLVNLYQQHERGMLDHTEFERQRASIAAKLKSLGGRT